MALQRSFTRGVRKSVLVTRHEDCYFTTQNYDQIRMLGKGSFGSVALLRDKRSGAERVCKVVDTSRMAAKVLQLTRAEIAVLCELDHPSIVKIYEYADDEHEKQIVFMIEHIAGGSCEELLSKSGRPLSESLVGKLVFQLFVALAHCHARGVVHRDLKPANMMLTASSLLGMPDLKLIDFGLSVGHGASSRDCVGTPAYMSPEVVSCRPVTPKADVWGAGVCAVELLVGRPPFGFTGGTTTAEVVFDRISSYQGFDDLVPVLSALPGWQTRSQNAKHFVRILLNPNESARPSARQAIQQPWLQVHRQEGKHLSNQMAQSLKAFTSAPSAARSCAMVVAARLGASDQESLGQAFIGADADGDGRIGREDLEDALANIDKWWWDSAVEVDADRLMDVADMSHSGGIDYTEFLAACLYAQSSSFEDLAERAFHALDEDKDGLLQVQAIQPAFRERDAPLVMSFPQDCSFGLDEWCETLQRYANSVPSPHPLKGTRPSLLGANGILANSAMPHLQPAGPYQQSPLPVMQTSGPGPQLQPNPALIQQVPTQPLQGMPMQMLPGPHSQTQLGAFPGNVQQRPLQPGPPFQMQLGGFAGQVQQTPQGIVPQIPGPTRMHAAPMCPPQGDTRMARQGALS